MTLEKFIQYLADLLIKKFTGRISIDVHKGDISKKVKRGVTDEVE